MLGFKGSTGSRYAFWVIVHLSLSFSTLAFNGDYDPTALISYLRNYTSSTTPRPRTGVLYRVHLPANFSGMEASFVTLRTSSFWERGVKLNPFFDIPPRIIPMPFVHRLDIVYENLGNWSSSYYEVPGYTFLTPVIGLAVYNATREDRITSHRLNFSVIGEPIKVNFTGVLVNQSPKVDKEMKCVKFDPSGLVELRKMVRPNICSSLLMVGHFAIASPSFPHPPSPPPSSPASRSKKHRLWEWWVIGFVAGLLGLLLTGTIFMVLCKAFRLRRSQQMEKRSEKSELLSERWIENSRLPCASMTRTRAAPETDYMP